MPNKKCRVCDSIFYAKPNHLKKGWGKYCSRACKGRDQIKGKFVKCHSCGDEVWRVPKELRKSKSGRYFCSKSCQTKWRNKQFIGSKHANWRGGEYTYHRIMKNYGIAPKCTDCGIIDKRVLLIHHIDYNRKNNDISNLMWLCRNCHYIIHKGKTF